MYIDVKSTVQLTSVELAQARPNYSVELFSSLAALGSVDYITLLFVCRYKRSLVMEVAEMVFLLWHGYLQ